MRPLDLTGQRFGRLTVIEKSIKRDVGKIMFKCHCDCGQTTDVRASSLTSGNTQSCGCLGREHVRESRLKHNHSSINMNHDPSPTYRSWSNMKTRCFNPNSEVYPHYGGRGINICPEWLDFINFLKDMGEKPRDCELHRIDNDEGYTPENCIWKNRTEHHSDHMKLTRQSMRSVL